MRDLNQLRMKENMEEIDNFLLRNNESMKNLSKDSIINLNKKPTEESSINISMYSRDGGNSLMVNRLTEL